MLQSGCNSPGVGWRKGCQAQRSHFKNQQLLTLNMLIVIVWAGWRLPLFANLVGEWLCSDFIVECHGYTIGPLLTLPPLLHLTIPPPTSTCLCTSATGCKSAHEYALHPFKIDLKIDFLISQISCLGDRQLGCWSNSTGLLTKHENVWTNKEPKSWSGFTQMSAWTPDNIRPKTISDTTASILTSQCSVWSHRCNFSIET